MSFMGAMALVGVMPAIIKELRQGFEAINDFLTKSLNLYHP